MSLPSVDLGVNPADETIRLGPLALRFLVTGENSAGTVAVFEILIPAGERLMAPAHSHDHYEETAYGIEGVLTWTVDGKLIDVGPGQALCIPRGAVHRFDNNGTEDVKGLCVVTPAAIGPQYLPRSGRGGEVGGRGSAGPRKDDGDHAPSRTQASSASATDIGVRRVKVSDRRHDPREEAVDRILANLLFGGSGRCDGIAGRKKSPPKDHFSSEALAFHKRIAGTSSRHWRSVVRGYWRSLYKRS